MSFAQVVITPGYNWQVFENPVLLVRRLKKSPGKSVMSCRNKYVLRIHWTLESSRDYGRNIAWVVPSPCWRDDESRNNRFRESDEIIQTTPRQDANGVYTSDRSRIHRSSGTGLVERQDCMRACITQQLGQGSQKILDAHIFTELVGIQLLLMNTLGPIARGERMAAEQVDVVFREVQTRKARKAQELLNKRLGRELESRGGTQTQSVRTAIS
jgi:hypothetical protein